MVTRSLKRRTRMVAGVLLGVSMSLSGLATARAATTGGTDPVQHYLDCFGELLSPNHPQDCGTLPTSNAPAPGGLSTPVHDGGATVTCIPYQGVEIYPAVEPSIETASLDPSWEFVPRLITKARVQASLPYCCDSMRGTLPSDSVVAALEESVDKFRSSDAPDGSMLVGICVQ